MAEPAGLAPGARVLVAGVGLAGSSAARALLARNVRVSLTATAESERVAALVAAGELPADLAMV